MKQQIVAHGLLLWWGTTRMKFQTGCLALVCVSLEAIHKSPKKYKETRKLQMLSEDQHYQTT